MTVKATIKLNDGTEIVRLFPSYLDLGEWAERHAGDYVSFDAKTILPGEIRQGRDT